MYMYCVHITYILMYVPNINRKVNYFRASSFQISFCNSFSFGKIVLPPQAAGFRFILKFIREENNATNLMMFKIQNSQRQCPPPSPH